MREWGADELDAFHRWIANPDVTRFLTWGSTSREESARQLEEAVVAQSESPRRRFFLAIERRAQAGQTIGDCGFTWIERGVAEIGYFLEPDFWGFGYASEAAKLVIELAFELDAVQVIATCDAANEASERVMRNIGMHQVHELRPGRRRYAIDRDPSG